ncbi:hypothetical protein AAF712_013108 [Marasmius tenuissimus]|uniref:Uncharacterized protein n=1 Tax=Marasmius tenuissimus TaxID=585030 RepID=A0ABR2ZGP9_9AGAR
MKAQAKETALSIPAIAAVTRNQRRLSASASVAESSDKVGLAENAIRTQASDNQMSMQDMGSFDLQSTGGSSQSCSNSNTNSGFQSTQIDLDFRYSSLFDCGEPSSTITSASPSTSMGLPSSVSGSVSGAVTGTVPATGPGAILPQM